MPIHCAKCGIANEDTMSFCQHCGTQLPQRISSQPSAGWGQPPNQAPSGWGQSAGSSASPAPGRPLFGAGYDSPYPAPALSAAQAQPSGSSSSAAGKLSMVSMVMGIVVASLMLFGLIPCLGWINWFTLLVGGVSKLIGWIAVFTEHKIPSALNKAIIGLVLSTIALFVGCIRLALGGGCL
ncbi:MAG: zinc-ribbon domain-containing protein [Acidobacteriota bacterium]